MKNLVLFPNREMYVFGDYKEAFDERFPMQDFDRFFVEDGGRKLEGYRFADVYVHWYCFEEPGYDVFVAMILQARAFAQEPGQTFLFS